MKVSVVTAICGSVLMSAAASAQLTAWGVTKDNRLISFDPFSPGFTLSDAALSGLGSGETLLGIDARPNSAVGQLIGVTSANRIVSVGFDGVVAGIGSGYTGFSTSNVGIDFNPTVDRIRVVGSNGLNRRLNPVTGGDAATDTTLSYNDGSGLVPHAVGTAYNKFFFGETAAAGSIRQFIVDSDRDLLGEVGSMAGGNASFNAGVVTPIGSGLGIDLSDDVGFDIFGETVQPFISNLSSPSGAAKFYYLNLSNGKAAFLGDIDASVFDFAVIPAPSAAALFGVAGLAGLRRRR